MHSHDDQRDITGAVTALTGIEQADNFFIAERSASGVVHAAKIQMTVKTGGIPLNRFAPKAKPRVLPEVAGFWDGFTVKIAPTSLRG